MNDYFEDLSYELREEVSDLKEQLGALKSIIRQTYKAIGCSDDIIEGEDWGGLPSRVACLKSAVDLSIQRGKKAEKNLEIYRRIDQLESIVESVLDDGDIEDSYYVLKTDYGAYQEEHHGIKHDRPHKEVGRGRPAKVHRVPTADEIVTAQQMTAPTRLEIEWRNIQKVGEDER